VVIQTGTGEYAVHLALVRGGSPVLRAAGGAFSHAGCRATAALARINPGFSV